MPPRNAAAECRRGMPPQLDLGSLVRPKIPLAFETLCLRGRAFVALNPGKDARTVRFGAVCRLSATQKWNAAATRLRQFCRSKIPVAFQALCLRGRAFVALNPRKDAACVVVRSDLLRLPGVLASFPLSCRAPAPHG